MKKRIVGCLIIMTFIMSMFQINAFAMEQNNSTSKNSVEIIDGELYIYLETQEEYDAVVKQIQDNNRRVEELWENALKEAENNNNNLSDTMTTRGSTYYSVSVPFTLYLSFFSDFAGYHSLRGHVTTDDNPTFIDYTGVYVKSKNTEETISDLTNDVVAIDSRRTYAVNSSFYVHPVTVGTQDTYPVDLYTEFYAAGTAMNYN